MSTDGHRQARCTICRVPIALRPENRYFPFCSEHCKMVDLGRWLNEEYTLPVGQHITERRLPDPVPEDDDAG